MTPIIIKITADIGILYYITNKIHQEEDKDLDFDEEEGSLFYDRS